MAAMQAACQHLEVRVNAIQLVVNDIVANDLSLDPDGKIKIPYWVAYQYTAIQNIKRELANLRESPEKFLTTAKQQTMTSNEVEFGAPNG